MPIQAQIGSRPQRKRQRAPLASYPHDISRGLGRLQVTSRASRPLGVNHAAVNEVVQFYRANFPDGIERPRGRLDLVRTTLAQPALVRRSPALQLGRSAAATWLYERRPHDNAPQADLDYASGFSSGDESEPSQFTCDAVSLLYTDGSTCTDVGPWWELGCWAGTHQLTGFDVLQMLLDVLTEATSIASCQIEALCICDELEELPGVVEGITLLKSLFLERQSAADDESGSNSDTFVHPITGDAIEIVIE